VLLMRQPYGRRIGSTVCYAHPQWYATQGYVVVIQDVRGRGTSEGEFDLFVHEAADGADAVAWAAELPGANGTVGMYGFSYQGTAQLLAAAQSGSALKALAPAMIGWYIRNDWAYENDGFCLQANLSWATQIGAETARLSSDAEAFAELYTASRALPFNGVRPARPDFIERHGQYTHYSDWLARGNDETYWRSMSPSALADDVDLPMLFIGGWYDTHLSGTLAAYRHYATAATAPTRLVVGPWAHLPWGRFLASTDFGADAVSDIDRLQVAWFDYWLKGGKTEVLAAPPVQLFEMGRNTWRGFDTWPVEHAPFWLAGDGRASVDERSGRLVESPPRASQTDWFVHDPWRPAPSVGGAFGTPPGPADRSTVDARGDVLTFTTPSLTRETRLAGEVSAHLWVTCEAPSFDLCCTLSRVTPSGRALVLTQGYRCVVPGAPFDRAIEIPMRATCASIAPGEALRLSIAAACFLAYPVNPGSGRDPVDASLDEARIIAIGVRHGASVASSVTLPIVAEPRPRKVSR
jgi:putative CocE/NonD family hydrolase